MFKTLATLATIFAASEAVKLKTEAEADAEFRIIKSLGKAVEKVMSQDPTKVRWLAETENEFI